MTGLLADTGASFLLWAAGENQPDPDVTPTEAACLDLLQDHHEEVGGRILESWGMDSCRGSGCPDPSCRFVPGSSERLLEPLSVLGTDLGGKGHRWCGSDAQA